MALSNSYGFRRTSDYMRMLRTAPSAIAEVAGSPEYPAVSGAVRFYQMKEGVLVSAQISGLPVSCGGCGAGIFAFHIHSGSSCTGNRDDPFADAGTHYNPGNCGHPEHAGDLPPLWSCRNGCAFEIFLTDRFSISEIVGRTVIVHLNPDDFTTQPSGNAGKKIACGEIRRCRSCRGSHQCGPCI